MTIEILHWDSQPISKPGIYRNVPMAAYHGQLTVTPSISGSGLKTTFDESPAHYFVTSYLNPAREPEGPNQALLFGRGAHHLLLGEQDFGEHFAIRPVEYPDAKTGEPKPWSGNSTWCKAWLAETADAGKDVLTANDLTNIRGMARSLEAHPLVQAGILGGLIEHTFVWLHEATGVWLKWRPDAMPMDSLMFADLKTTADVTDYGIQRTIDNLLYDMGAGLGAMACRAILGREMEDYSYVFVEKTEPWSVRVKAVKPADIDLGVASVEAALGLFKRSLDTGEWTPPGGLQTDAEYVEINPRARERREERIERIKMELAS